MKKIIPIIVLMALMVPIFAYAATLMSGEQMTIGRDEVIPNNLYVAGSDLNVAGRVIGDLMAAGGNLTITGQVEKDAALAGGNILIDGSIGEDLRVAGGQINIKGNIGGDIIAAGGKVHILPGSTVGGDLIAAGGQIINDGSVKGKTLIHMPEKKEKRENREGFLGLGIWWFIKTLMMLATGLVIYFFLRPGMREVFKKGMDNFWPEVGRGFAFLILAPIALIITFITIIGIPLSISGILIYIAFIIMSSLFGAIILGGVVSKYAFKKSEAMTAGIVFGGIVLYQILKLIPFLGWIIVFIFFLAGLGSLTNILYRQTFVKWRRD